MWVGLIGIGIVMVIVAVVGCWVIWADLRNSVPEDVDRQIEENEKLLADFRAPRRTKAVSRRIVLGKKLDTVRFAYMNDSGEYSERRVTVQMIGEWEFEGIDLDKGDERTFRYDRVIGDITSTKTGLVAAPEEWAGSFRQPAIEQS